MKFYFRATLNRPHCLHVGHQLTDANRQLMPKDGLRFASLDQQHRVTAALFQPRRDDGAGRTRTDEVEPITHGDQDARKLGQIRSLVSPSTPVQESVWVRLPALMAVAARDAGTLPQTHAHYGRGPQVPRPG